jgi:hypothetical protein
VATPNLELHPDFRSLEPAMVRWAEEHLAVPDAGGQRMVEFWVGDDDTVRQGVLDGFGYLVRETGGWMRWPRFWRGGRARAARSGGA